MEERELLNRYAVDCRKALGLARQTIHREESAMVQSEGQQQFQTSLFGVAAAPKMEHTQLLTNLILEPAGLPLSGSRQLFPRAHA